MGSDLDPAVVEMFEAQSGRCEHGRIRASCPFTHPPLTTLRSRVAGIFRGTGGPGYNLLDLSNHDESTFDAECLKSNGVTDVIMGCQLGGGPARRMIPKLEKADVNVPGTYAFLGFKNWWIEPTNQAIAVAKQFGIGKVYLDAEADDANSGATGNEVNPQQRAQRLVDCCDLVLDSGLKLGIYTAKWWWVPYMANTHLFADIDLWLGGPYGVPPIINPGFGGWAEVEIHQHTSTYYVCDRGRDANYRISAGSEGNNEGEIDMGMTEAERDVQNALIRAFTGMGRDEGVARIAEWNTYPEGHEFAGQHTGNSLLDGYTAEQEKLGKVSARLDQHIADAAGGEGIPTDYKGIAQALREAADDVEALGEPVDNG